MSANVAARAAFRFGLDQGDLSTVEGRAKLFQLLCRHRPKQIWYSPVCGPWSSWSQLNASRSLHHQQEYQNKRNTMLYQIALGIILFRRQVEHGDHFHWEQPQKSLMFQCTHLAEVHEHTQACQFDMCRAGNLVDPENYMPMKKGMTILTTFAPLFDRLHGLVCDHRHQHQPIEGACKLKNGERVLRTQYTEVYPRKFARTAALTFMKGDRHLPYNWKAGMSLGFMTEHAMVTTKFRQKSTFPKSDLITPMSRSLHEAKRIKLDPQQASHPTMERRQEVIQAISQQVPRVGKREITDQHIIQQLQQMFTDKHIHRVMTCRGTERTMMPPNNMLPQEAPYRRMLILRRDGNIQFEKHWEQWTNLSKRQLVRPSHACRLNVTMFASDQVPTSSNEDLAKDDNDDQVQHHLQKQVDAARSPDQSGQKATQFESPMQVPDDGMSSIRSEEACTDNTPSKDAEEPDRLPTTTREEINTPSQESVNRPPEPVTQQQNERFRRLPKWEQQSILRMHKNLGHPSNDRLAKALQVNGSRPEVVQAALEIRCAVCSANAPPKHSRPAALKPMLDFNHKIYLDGIKWTNKKGDTFHFYHVVDAGSNYHVAMAAPAKTTEELIRHLNQNWISWAGPPREMVVDSATEMNSEPFSSFIQRFGIRATTTCPEAHWQSGKIERHGAFLQSMLDKVDFEYPINDYPALQVALNQCTQSKNTLSVRHGYAPEIIVFGKHSRLPGSVLSDESIPSHQMALDELDTMPADGFRKMLAVREAARRAFHKVDNCDILRRAALRRACPSRGVFSKGEWVMIWRDHKPT